MSRQNARFCLRISRGVTGASPVAACMVTLPGASQRTVPVANGRVQSVTVGDRSSIALCNPADHDERTISASPRQALGLEGDLADNEVLTYLQMLSPDDLRPDPKPPAMLEVQELDQWSPLIRRTTVDIGRAHQWPSQGWDEQHWQTYQRREHLRHWVALIHGGSVGLLSLDVSPGGDVEVDTFGLLYAQERTRANDARRDYEPALRKASTTRARRWTQ